MNDFNPDIKYSKLVNNDNKLYSRWLNKRNNAQKEGIKCLLTYEEYAYLVYEAGLKSSQLGFSGENYVLARYNDSGDYFLGNCRFISQLENAHEKKFQGYTKEAREKGLKKLKELFQDEKFREEQSIRIIIGQHKHDMNFNLDQYLLDREEKKKYRYTPKENGDPRYMGVHNSSFGYYWITNGITSKKMERCLW